MEQTLYLYRKQYAHPGESRYITMEKDGELYDLVPEFPIMLREELGYWRNAYSTEAWLKAHVPNSRVDGAEISVKRETLETLYHIVLEVLKSIELTPGDVFMGRTYDGGMSTDETRPGMVIKDTTTAEALLPKPYNPGYYAYGYDYRYFEELVVTKDVLRLVMDSNVDVEFSFLSRSYDNA